MPRLSPEKSIQRELQQIRTGMQMLEAAYFHLTDVLASRHIPFLLTLGEAAQVLGVGKGTVAMLVAERRIRAKKVGQRKMVLRSSLELFAEQGLAFRQAPGPRRELVRRPQCIHDLTSVEHRARDERRERSLAMVMAGAGPGWGPS